MFHSQKHYNQIRQAIRDQLAHDQIEPLISSALQQKPTAGSMRYACRICGAIFVKSPHLKKRLNTNYCSTLLSYLQHLANKYNITYLQESTILQRYEE